MWLYPIMVIGWLLTGIVMLVLVATNPTYASNPILANLRWLAFLLAGYNLLRWWMIRQARALRQEQIRKRREAQENAPEKTPVRPEFGIFSKDD
ncbi:MAG: hypothetical protein ACFCD0_03205 [Gemmataceae bacterium]